MINIKDDTEKLHYEWQQTTEQQEAESSQHILKYHIFAKNTSTEIQLNQTFIINISAVVYNKLLKQDIVKSNSKENDDIDDKLSFAKYNIIDAFKIINKKNSTLHKNKLESKARNIYVNKFVKLMQPQLQRAQQKKQSWLEDPIQIHNSQNNTHILNRIASYDTIYVSILNDTLSSSTDRNNSHSPKNCSKWINRINNFINLINNSPNQEMFSLYGKAIDLFLHFPKIGKYDNLLEISS